jgi:hypothetical protein
LGNTRTAKRPRKNFMRTAIVSLLLVLNCNYAFALDGKTADRMGDNFLAALKRGQSAQFVLQQFNVETFLVTAFGQEYTKLSTKDKAEIRTSLSNTLRTLYSSPKLVAAYKKSIYQQRAIQQQNGDYIYEYTTQLPGGQSFIGAIRLRDINKKTWIVDMKNGYWMTDRIKSDYAQLRGKISLKDLMKASEVQAQQELR